MRYDVEYTDGRKSVIVPAGGLVDSETVNTLLAKSARRDATSRVRIDAVASRWNDAAV